MAQHVTAQCRSCSRRQQPSPASSAAARRAGQARQRPRPSNAAKRGAAQLAAGGPARQQQPATAMGRPGGASARPSSARDPSIARNGQGPVAERALCWPWAGPTRAEQGTTAMQPPFPFSFLQNSNSKSNSQKFSIQFVHHLIPKMSNLISIRENISPRVFLGNSQPPCQVTKPK